MDIMRETATGLDAIAASMKAKDERIERQKVSLARQGATIRQNNEDYYTAKLIIQDLKHDVTTLRSKCFELEKELKCQKIGKFRKLLNSLNLALKKAQA